MNDTSSKVMNAQHDDDNDEELNCCPICLMEIDRVSSNDARLDSCKHQFHIDCIKQWSSVKPSCPLCKQTFTRISFDGQIFIVKKKGKRNRDSQIHNELFGEDDEGEDDDDDDDDNDDYDDDNGDDDVLGYCIICLGECEPIDGQFLACRSRSCTSVVHQFCIDRFNDNSSWLCAECSRRRYQHSSHRYNVRESISNIISNGSSGSSSSRRSVRGSFSGGNRNSSNNSTHSILRISDADAVAMRHSTTQPPSRSTTTDLGDELSIKQQLLPYSNGKNSRELIENQIALARQLNNASSSIKAGEDDKSKKMSEDDIIKASKAIIKNEKQQQQTSSSSSSSSSRRKTSTSSSTSSLLKEVLGQSQSEVVVQKKQKPLSVPDIKSDQVAAFAYKSGGYTDIVRSKAEHKTAPLSVSSSISKLMIPIESTTSASAAALFLSRLRTANNELKSIGIDAVDMSGLFHEIKSFALSSDLDLIGKLLDQGLLDDLSTLFYPFNGKFIDYRDREMILRTINSLPVKKCHTSSEKKITKALSFCVSINEAYDNCNHGNVNAVATRIIKSWLKCFFKHDKQSDL